LAIHQEISPLRFGGEAPPALRSKWQFTCKAKTRPGRAATAARPGLVCPIETCHFERRPDAFSRVEVEKSPDLGQLRT